MVLNFAKSLRFIVSSVLFLLSFALLLTAFASISTFGKLAEFQQELDNLSDQRANTAQLVLTMHHIAESPDTVPHNQEYAIYHQQLDDTWSASQELEKTIDLQTEFSNTESGARFHQDVGQSWQAFSSVVSKFLIANSDEYPTLIAQVSERGTALSNLLDKHGAEIRGLSVSVRTSSLQTIGFFVLVSLLIAVGSIYALYRILVPVNRLITTTKKFAQGDLQARAKVGGVTEVVNLASAFNEMADSIQQRSSELVHANISLEEQTRMLQKANQDLQSTQVALQEANITLEKANRVKSTFLASMSHELRTPLNAVINFTKFVKRGVMGPVNERQADALGTAIDSASHLLSLINDVLDISKIESGSLNLFIESNVVVPDLINKALSATKSMLVEKPVQVHAEIDPDLPPLNGDRQRIFQIILNILSNACKFTEQGDIRVQAHVKPDLVLPASVLTGSTNGTSYVAGPVVLITVEDTGPGINMDEQNLVFEAFKQTQSGVRQGGGTGLGMPISKRLAEAHGGQLWFTSTPGQGTTFYVALPVTAEAVAVNEPVLTQL